LPVSWVLCPLVVVGIAESYEKIVSVRDCCVSTRYAQRDRHFRYNDLDLTLT